MNRMILKEKMRKKSGHKMVGFQIVGFILVNNFSVSLATDNVHAMEKGSSFVSDIANIIMAIAAVTNIWAIIWYYLKDKDIRNQEQQTNNRLYWYRDVIVDKNIKALENFYGQSLAIIEKYTHLAMTRKDLSEQEFSRRVKMLFREFNQEKYLLGHSFIDVIGVVNKSLGQDLYQLFDKFQDDFTLSLAGFSGSPNPNDFIKLKNLVYDQKRTVLEKIYSFGFTQRG